MRESEAASSQSLSLPAFSRMKFFSASVQTTFTTDPELGMNISSELYTKAACPSGELFHSELATPDPSHEQARAAIEENLLLTASMKKTNEDSSRQD